ALLKSPDGLAVDVLEPFYKDRQEAAQAVENNGGRADMTAGEFADMWRERFEAVRPVREVTQFAVTGTPFDFLPNEKKLMLADKLPSMLAESRKARKQQVLDTIMPVMQQHNGDWTKIDPAMRAQAMSLGIWDQVVDY